MQHRDSCTVDEVRCLVHTVMFWAMSCAKLYSKTIRRHVNLTSCGLLCACTVK